MSSSNAAKEWLPCRANIQCGSKARRSRDKQAAVPTGVARKVGLRSRRALDFPPPRRPLVFRRTRTRCRCVASSSKTKRFRNRTRTSEKVQSFFEARSNGQVPVFIPLRRIGKSEANKGFLHGSRILRLGSHRALEISVFFFRQFQRNKAF